MVFVRYKNTGGAGDYREVSMVYPTQAAADAVTDTATTAFVGAVADQRVQPGSWINPTDGTVRLNRPNTDSNAQTAHRALFHTGQQLDVVAAELAAGFSDQQRQRFHDYRFHLREAHYLVAVDGNLTAAQKIAFCREVARGPRDLRVSTFGGLRGAVREFYRRSTEAGSLPPTAPAVWVDPTTGMATDLWTPYQPSGTVPDSVDLTREDWIDSL